MRIGILSGGGDCGGINALIRSAVQRAEAHGYEVVGIRRGWAGLVVPDTVRLTFSEVAEIASEGGTVLLTSRTNPFKQEGGPEAVLRNVRKLGISALVVIGGEDTQGVAHRLASKGLKFVGAPKTMDNDLSETDVTFGFDSAVNVAVEAIDRVRTTGISHERVMVVEVMGRDSGWVAAYAGIATGAHVVLVPEREAEVAEVCRRLKERSRSGRKFSLVVVAEGARLRGLSQETRGQRTDQFGHARLGGVGSVLAKEIVRRTGLDAREVVLGHLIRGGPPSAFDRVVCARLGRAAVDAIKRGETDVMVAVRGSRIVSVPVAKALKSKTVDTGLLQLATDLGLA